MWLRNEKIFAVDGKDRSSVSCVCWNGIDTGSYKILRCQHSEENQIKSLNDMAQVDGNRILYFPIQS
jgi:hypothetical protein